MPAAAVAIGEFASSVRHCSRRPTRKKRSEGLCGERENQTDDLQQLFTSWSHRFATSRRTQARKTIVTTPSKWLHKRDGAQALRRLSGDQTNLSEAADLQIDGRDRRFAAKKSRLSEQTRDST